MMHDMGNTSVRDSEKLSIGRKAEVLNLVVLDPWETHNLTLQIRRQIAAIRAPSSSQATACVVRGAESHEFKLAIFYIRRNIDRYNDFASGC
jgi:hypothetical protein